MTSAAAPAVSGAASLVPPLCMTDEGAPVSFVQSAYCLTSAVQSVQFRSPGATRSTVRPSSVTPPDDRELMLLSR
jgi:hypothetical protein